MKDASTGDHEGPGSAAGPRPSHVLGIAKSLEAYAKPESNVARDLDEIARFFGIPRTGTVMATLTGATASSLSRAGQGPRAVGQDARAVGRVAGRIAILAALVMEMHKYLVDVSESEQPSDMYRWLMSGRIDTKAGSRRPLEVLSDPDGAAVALAEIRAARRHLKRKGKPGTDHSADVNAQ